MGVAMNWVVTTVLVDPNELFREGLRRVLANTRFRVKRLGCLLDEVRLRMPRSSGSVLVLLGTTGSLGSLTLDISRFRATNPDIRLVVLGDNCEREDISQAFYAGANGYLSKTASCEALTKSLELVMLGASVLSAEAARRVFGSDDIRSKAIRSEALTPENDKWLENQKNLSEREMSIVYCLMSGESNKLIARKYGIAEATVKVHIKAILRKISVKNRTQAAVWAHHNLSIASRGGSRSPDDTDDRSLPIERKQYSFLAGETAKRTGMLSYDPASS
jgi:two-component system, NarL family, nitrate/nitrite response regulator NarL